MVLGLRNADGEADANRAVHEETSHLIRDYQGALISKICYVHTALYMSGWTREHRNQAG